MNPFNLMEYSNSLNQKVRINIKNINHKCVRLTDNEV